MSETRSMISRLGFSCAAFALIVGATLLASPAVGHAAEGPGSTLTTQLANPEGRALVTVEGLITNTNKDGKAVMTRNVLDSFPMTKLETETPWTKGVQKFEGVSMKDFLSIVGATGTTLKIVALNDYSIEVPVTDSNYGALFATKHNDNIMTVKDKGPLWLIYPMSDMGTVNDINFGARSIWQIKRIEVR